MIIEKIHQNNRKTKQEYNSVRFIILIRDQ